jgi:hypothetical protein
MDHERFVGSLMGSLHITSFEMLLLLLEMTFGRLYTVCGE